MIVQCGQHSGLIDECVLAIRTPTHCAEDQRAACKEMKNSGNGLRCSGRPSSQAFNCESRLASVALSRSSAETPGGRSGRLAAY
jgi:hypothetical protein